jgi:hypothetical protein
LFDGSNSTPYRSQVRYYGKLPSRPPRLLASMI